MNKIKDKTSEGNDDKFVIQHDKKDMMYAIALGFISYFIFIFLIKTYGFQLLKLQESFQSSFLWNIPLTGTFLSLLLIVVIGSVFGEKNSNNQYEFNKKYQFLSPILSGLLFLMLLSFGFIFGIFLTIVTKLT